MAELEVGEIMVNFKAVEQELEKVLFEEVDLLCEEMSPKEKVQKIEAEIRADLKSFKQKCTDGFCYCLDSLKELAEMDPEIRLEKIKGNLQQAFGKLSGLEQVHEFGTQAVDGKSWCDLLGFSQETSEALYKAAKYLFEQERYREAEAAFSFITTFDGTNYASWLGLGHANFHCENFHKAIQAYAIAHWCDQTSVWPHMYAANTFEVLHDYKRALVALEHATKTAEKAPQKDRYMQEALKQRLAMVKERAEKNR